MIRFLFVAGSGKDSGPSPRDPVCPLAQWPQHKHQTRPMQMDRLTRGRWIRLQRWQPAPLRTRTTPLYQSVCLQKQFQHINSPLLWRPDVAMRADRCSYIPSVDTPFVSLEGLRGVFTRRWLFLWKQVQFIGETSSRRGGTNMKITESSECIDIENNDWESEYLAGKLIEKQDAARAEEIKRLWSAFLCCFAKDWVWISAYWRNWLMFTQHTAHSTDLHTS